MDFLLALALTFKGFKCKREAWCNTYIVIDKLGLIRDSRGDELFYEDMLAIDWTLYEEDDEVVL